MSPLRDVTVFVGTWAYTEREYQETCLVLRCILGRSAPMEDDGPVHRKACHLFPELSELQFKVQPLWRTVWRFLKKLEIELLYDPAIPLLGIHTEETRIERDTCAPMFTAAQCIIARTWEQPRCPYEYICGTYTQCNITQLLKRMHLNQF